ncbi:MAG: hypothetical protein HC893_11635 [Chloroflexaceae bacterium]|nr:hypothetical protein [Chloroflexaceae bacterium]
MNTTKTIYGIFSTVQQAAHVVARLRENNFEERQIETITIDTARTTYTGKPGANYHDKLPERTGSYADMDLQREQDDQTRALLVARGIPDKDARNALNRLREGSLVSSGVCRTRTSAARQRDC